MIVRPLTIECEGSSLLGMLHTADGPARTGVLIMVAGGPQYRIGGARQLVLWSRRFAADGFPVLRFDFRGMGDSYGEYAGFEHVQAELRSVIERFFQEVPTLERLVLWGECNACSASLTYAHQDPRISGIVMLNPWVRTEAGRARTVIKHYYLQRLTQRSFWKKVLSLNFDAIGSLRSALGLLRTLRGAPAVSSPVVQLRPGTERPSDDPRPLPDRMLEGLQKYRGRVLLILSGRDNIAAEFCELLKQSADWREALLAHQTVRHDLPLADHTFSCQIWRDQVADWGSEWLSRKAAD